jgi:hypothetical protein
MLGCKSRKRPSADEIDILISDFIHKLGANVKELKELSYNSINKIATTTNSLSKTQLFKTHPEAIYTSRLLDLPDLPEPVNFQNQEEFVSSRNIVQIQSGEFIIYYINIELMLIKYIYFLFLNI